MSSELTGFSDTMIQGGTTNTPVSAISAAIATNTRLLLGLWASAGQEGISNEIAALTAAVSQYGTAFTNLVDGISVGSEDLYRISPTGIENNSGVGAGPDDIVNYITQVRNAIANTAASGKPVGHVDTWTAYVNGSNQAAINACDFIGMDAYPYFQNTIANGIDVGQSVFNDALDATRGAVGGKPVWVTETGWPVSGQQMNQAVASVQNAQTYWQQVACQLFADNVNTYWYTLQDALPDVPSPSFGLVGVAGGETPLFDLSCSPSSVSSASAAASSTALPIGGSSAPAPDAGSPGATSSQPAGGSAGQSTGSSGSATSAPAPGGSSAPATGSSGSPTSAPAPGPSGGSGSGSSGASTVELTTFTTETECPVTVTGSSGAVSTVLSTSTLTITSCAGGCSKSATPAPSASTAVSPQPASSQPGAPAPSPTSTGSTSAGACPADLSGPYEYPHLMVPIDENQPDTALGTSYNGTFSSSVSTIFNFDIPPSDAGKTCTLVFLLPDLKELETSSYTLTGSGGIDVKGLQGPADQSTTYNNAPAGSSDCGSVNGVAPGNSYTIASGPCASGQRIAYEVSATGGLDLNYFQDYNPSPLGMYITVC